MSLEDDEIAARVKQIQEETAEQLGIKAPEPATTDPKGTTLPSRGTGAGRGFVFPPDEIPNTTSTNKKPTSVDIAKKGVEIAKNLPTNNIGETFLDPSIDMGIAGAYLGAKSTGASLNPLNVNKFLQTAPEVANAQGAAKGTQAWLNSALTQFPDAPQRLTVQELGDLTKMPVNTSKDIWNALVRLNGSAAIRTPVVKYINGQKTTVGYRSTPAQMPIPLEEPSAISKMGTFVEDVAPGATKFVKGALPTIGAAAKGLGVGMTAGDVLSRLYSGDTTGAGISGAGGAAALLLAPEFGIPAALASYAINKARDEPVQNNIPTTRRDTLSERQKLAKTLP